MRKITAIQRIGTYVDVRDPSREVDMRKGTLFENRGGKMTTRPVFFYVRRLQEVIVMRHELERFWRPKYGSHILGDQHNAQPDLLSKLGDRQDTRWEKWRSK